MSTKINYKEVISKDISVNSSVFKLILQNSSDSIRFEIYDKNIPVGISYQAILNVQQLEELNPYFKQFQSIKNIIKNFKRLIESNHLNIEQNNSELKLFFINQVNEDEKIYIKLNQIEEDTNSKVNKLVQIIKDLKEENANIKKEIKELKEQKIQSLINDNISLKEKLNETFKEINILKNKDNITSNLDKESSIVNNKEDIDLLNSRISCILFSKNIKYKKLYRATENGDRSSDFHRFCDNKGPTLTIFKSKKGYIFGGFTLVNWDSSEKNKPDPDAFVFSLNQKKIYKIKDSKNAIECNSGKGPTFGDHHAIDIDDNFLSKDSQNRCEVETDYGDNLGLTEDEYFLLDEVEVLLIE